MTLIASPNSKNSVWNFAWLADWEGPFEGPMSRVLKFGWANSLTAEELCRSLFGRGLVQTSNPVTHGRTLLAPHWARNEGPTAMVPIASKVTAGGLDCYTTNWVHFIASDISFRFCPTCLNHGYQSVLFQIDGLALCPIHGEALLDHCRCCGALTPRYALTKTILEKPFHCSACGSPYSGKLQPSAWKAPELHCQAQVVLNPIVQWLQKLDQSQLNWLQWEDWFGPWLDSRLEWERRLSTFDALTRLIPLELDCQYLRLPPRPIQIFSGNLRSGKGTYNRLSLYEVALSEGEIQDRRSIYKAIRRYAIKRLAGCYRANPEHNRDPIEISWSDEVFKLSSKKCVKAQSLLLWRLRFEESSSLSRTTQEQRPMLHLRPAALNWPWAGSADDAAWAGYVLASLHASIEVVNDWWRRATSLPDTDIYGTDKTRAMALYIDFAALLSPIRYPVLPRITIVSNASTDQKQDRPLFVIGPSTATEKGFHLPLCPDNIRCAACVNRRRNEQSVTIDRSFKGFVTVPATLCRHTVPDSEENDIPIRTIDRLRLPPNLDGSSGPFRAKPDQCLIKASNDLEAIQLWLDAQKNQKNTYRMYQQQVERCLLWAVCQQRKPLSSLDNDDASAFAGFLLDPQPRERWIYPGTALRTTDAWRPFRGALSTRSRDQAIKILSNFFDWLRNMGYVNFNPWTSIPYGDGGEPRRKYAPMTTIASRHYTVTPAEWHYVTQALSRLSHEAGDLRVKMLIYLTYFGALKPGELSALTLGSLRSMASEFPQRTVWLLRIEGRPDDLATIYLLPPAQGAISDYLDERGLSLEVSAKFSDLLLVEPGRGGGIQEGQSLSRLTKRVFEMAAELARSNGELPVASRLDEASLGWLSNAFEAHVSGRGIRGSWPWHLLAAKKTIAPGIFRYIPQRTELPMTDVLLGFRELETMWNHV